MLYVAARQIQLTVLPPHQDTIARRMTPGIIDIFEIIASRNSNADVFRASELFINVLCRYETLRG